MSFIVTSINQYQQVLMWSNEVKISYKLNKWNEFTMNIGNQIYLSFSIVIIISGFHCLILSNFVQPSIDFMTMIQKSVFPQNIHILGIFSDPFIIGFWGGGNDPCNLARFEGNLRNVIIEENFSACLVVSCFVICREMNSKHSRMRYFKGGLKYSFFCYEKLKFFFKNTVAVLVSYLLA